MKHHDIIGVCNALVDILVQVEDKDFAELGIRKGVMHLVDSARQQTVLKHFSQRSPAIELGGSAMNAIRTLAALGKRTVFCGMTGEDDFGARIRERMHQLGIKAHLGHSNDATGSCVILITPDGERTMNTCLGASRMYSEKQIPADDVASARILHFCGYQWDTEGQKNGIKEAIRVAKKNNTLISFDVADPFVVERYADEFKTLIAEHAAIVFANREEARLLYGTTPEDAAARISAGGAIAVIKLGAEGALIRHGSQSFKIAPVPTRVVDTTAAGDMFAAGFLYGHLSGNALPLCGRAGAFLASDVISRVGATVSESALAEVPVLK